MRPSPAAEAVAEREFGELFRRFKRRALALARRYVRDDAEDVVQDAFLMLWTTCYEHGDVEPEGNDALLFKILRDLIKDQWRKRRTEVRRDENRALVFDISSRIENMMETKRVAEGSILAGRLAYVVEALPEPRRSLFRIAYANGWNVRAAADELHLKLNTARWHLARAVEIVRSALEKDGYEVPATIPSGRRGRGGRRDT